MDLALNNLQRLICHNTQTTKTKQMYMLYKFTQTQCTDQKVAKDQYF